MQVVPIMQCREVTQHRLEMESMYQYAVNATLDHYNLHNPHYHHSSSESGSNTAMRLRTLTATLGIL